MKLRRKKWKEKINNKKFIILTLHMKSIAIGFNKGHCHTKVPSKKAHKPHHGAQRSLTHETIREICGYAPYEKRVLELLRNGFDKRALRLCKGKVNFIFFLPLLCYLRLLAHLK